MTGVGLLLFNDTLNVKTLSVKNDSTHFYVWITIL